MESARVHRPLTISEAETFWTEGTPAYPSAPGEKPETHPHASGDSAGDIRLKEGSSPNEGAGVASATVCGSGAPEVRSVSRYEAMHPNAQPGMEDDDYSVDMPGVGVVEQPRIALGQPAAQAAGSERKWAEESLVCELVFAARELAERRIVVIPQIPTGGLRLWCSECRQSSATRIEHAHNCLTERVLAIYEKLDALGDGNLSSVAALLHVVPSRVYFCQRCGQEDDLWLSEQKPEYEVWLNSLKLNQRVGASAKGVGHTLWTHCCADLSKKLIVDVMEGGAR